MGCSGSKTAGSPMMRMLEYERMAKTEDEGLKIQPNSLACEEWREGLISPRTFYNWFHAGYYSAYIQNPNYMLIIDFREVDDWLKERVSTSIHHKRLHNYQHNLHAYSQIVLYDRDGCSVGNIKSPLRKIYLRLRSDGLDPRIILGGFKSLSRQIYSSIREHPTFIPFASQIDLLPGCYESPEEASDDEAVHDLEVVHPHVGRVEPERRCIPWLPSMVIEDKIYLGRSDQAQEARIIKSLGITHILSTSSISTGKLKGLVYILVNKTSFSLSTIKLTNSFIIEAINQGGRILVHGCDGTDQSAAVVIAAIMQYKSATLEDSLQYVETSRYGIKLSSQWIRILLRLEAEIFGMNLTDIDTLWV